MPIRSFRRARGIALFSWCCFWLSSQFVSELLGRIKSQKLVCPSSSKHVPHITQCLRYAHSHSTHLQVCWQLREMPRSEDKLQCHWRRVVRQFSDRSPSNLKSVRMPEGGVCTIVYFTITLLFAPAPFPVLLIKKMFVAVVALVFFWYTFACDGQVSDIIVIHGPRDVHKQVVITGPIWCWLIKCALAWSWVGHCPCDWSQSSWRRARLHFSSLCCLLIFF